VAWEQGLARAEALLRSKRLVALTGAGCSTESGIPDYRGPETRRRARNPIQGRELVRSPEVRRRYWARAVLGWERFSRATPNAAHRALARLEEGGLLGAVITQNVDGLHQAAGSRRVLELHGALREVVCLACAGGESRASSRLGSSGRIRTGSPSSPRSCPTATPTCPRASCPGFAWSTASLVADRCVPRVVFFGENVPRPLVEEAFSALDEAEALLVLGTSLAVFSGYRFVLRAAGQKIPIVALNLGEIRGVEHFAAHVEARVGEVLPGLAARLLGLSD
jgi:NAD-dependent deacetylase sirtuin 4